ncbi:NAD(P)/FAD-dependent oxidoreductase [Dongia deserti]|uniref:NAD(P)/FAD-dependent oxidoreductase n=1 Tax=Dongia deserti TaxID=2268030 RepID=UPI000E64F093|nr:NAD(P)/FAD-dependent oxidoreductase [Dongia deserti]
MAVNGDKVRPRVLILGAGFGGLSAAKALRNAPCDVVVIDRRNYHLFQPLLYQVATAALSPAEIASPIRSILSRQKNARVLMARVTGIDAAAKRVLLQDGRTEAFDYLIVATGARHAYFGHDDWEGCAPGLKKIEDATDIRRRILLAFERAEAIDDPEARKALLTFVVIGGGATGVEMAGAIGEVAHWALADEFRVIDPTQARIVLIEAGPRLLPAFPEDLAEHARKALVKLGVEVQLGRAVEQCDEGGIVYGGERLPARTIVWAAGVQASPAAKWLGAEKDRAGRVIVAKDLTVPGHPDIFVVGDTALVLDPKGQPVPGIAPAAKQMGAHAGRVIAARLAGRTEERPFRYRHAGSLATIGRSAAIADFGWLKVKGWLAWWLWGIAHIYFLIDFRSRFIVALQWLWSYFTFRRGARLITGGEGEM